MLIWIWHLVTIDQSTRKREKKTFPWSTAVKEWAVTMKGSTGHTWVSCWLYLFCQHYIGVMRATVHLTGEVFRPLPWWAFIADRCHWLFHPAHPCGCPGQCWQLHRYLVLTTSLQKLKNYSTNSQWLYKEFSVTVRQPVSSVIFRSIGKGWFFEASSRFFKAILINTL